MKRLKKTVQIIFWAVVVTVIIIGAIRLWDIIGGWVLWLGGALGALFGGAKVIDLNEQERVKQRDQEIREDIENQREIRSRLDSETETWRDKVKKLHRLGTIVILCLLFAARPVLAVYIPEDYEELKVRYLVAIELLDEADRMLAEYQALDDMRMATIEKQAARINELELDVHRLNCPSWGITGGIDLADSARWRLGVARKKGIISIGTGVGGGDGFSLWGEVGLWIR